MSKKIIEYLDEVMCAYLEHKKNMLIARAITIFLVIFLSSVLFSNLIERVLVTIAVFAMLIYLKD